VQPREIEPRGTLIAMPDDRSRGTPRPPPLPGQRLDLEDDAPLAAIPPPLPSQKVELDDPRLQTTASPRPASRPPPSPRTTFEVDATDAPVRGPGRTLEAPNYRPPPNPRPHAPPPSRAPLAVVALALLAGGGGAVAWRQGWLGGHGAPAAPSAQPRSTTTATVELTISPLDATVRLGDTPVALVGGRAVVPLAAGIYTLSVTRLGFTKDERVIDLRPGTQLKLTIALPHP
jgi:hypothetical protein